MIPQRLHIQGFRSFRQPVEIDLSGITIASITGRNGAGKSTMIEAMLFGLFGKVRTPKNEDAISTGMDKATVELDFIEGGETWRVRATLDSRSRDVTVWRLDPEPKLMPLKGVKAADMFLRNLIGMSYEDFVLSSIMEQGDSSRFFIMKPVERMAFLSGVLELYRFDRLSELASSNKSQTKGRKEQLANNIDSLEQRLASFADLPDTERISAEILELENKHREMDIHVNELRKKASRLEVLKSEFSGIENSINDRIEDIKRASSGMNQLQQRETELRQDFQPIKDTDVLMDRYETARAMVNRLQRSRNRYQQMTQEIDNLERLIHDRDQVLRSEIEKEYALVGSLERQQDSLRDRLKDMNTVLAGVAKLAELRSEYRELEKLRTIESALKEQRASLDAAIMADRDHRKATMEKLAQEKERLAKELSRLPEAEGRLDKLHEEGRGRKHRDVAIAELRAEKDSLAQKQQYLFERVESHRLEETEIKEKKSQLMGQEGKNCPLCGSELDRPRLRRILVEYTERIDSARKGRTLANSEIKEFQKQIREIESNITRLEKSNEDEEFDRQIRQCEREISELKAGEKRISDLDAEIAGLRRTGDDAEKRQKLEDVERQLDTLNFDGARFETVRGEIDALSPLEGTLREMEKQQTESAQLDSEIEAIRQKLKKLEASLQSRDFVRDESKSLKSLLEDRTAIGFDQEEFEKWQTEWDNVVDIPTRIEKHSSTLRELKQIARGLAEKQSDIDLLTGQLQALEDRVITLTDQIDDIAADLVERDTIESHLRETAVHLNLKRAEEAVLKEKIRQKNDTTTELEKLRAEFKQAERELVVSETLREIAGTRGVQAYIISRALPFIAEQADRMLALLLPGTELKLVIKNRRNLDIQIWRDGEKRAYQSLSGGERFRTDFALRVGISRLIARRHGKGLSTLIIDEGFGTQDEQGIDLFTEALRQVSKEFETILVITHLDALKQEFPTNIGLKKGQTTSATIEHY